jgi:uncharacterized protein (DUF1499 family)
MRSPQEPQATPLSRWTSRLALFCLVLVIAAFFLHRVFGMPTPVAANVVLTALAGAAVAVLLGIVAGVRIWRDGGDGTARIAVGMFISLALLSGPLVLAALAREYPMLHDVTTDAGSPPPFDVLSLSRSKAENAATYPGAASAKLQAQSYPDLKPMMLNRSQSETFELVVDALKRQKLTIVREQEPNPETGAPGFIEAVDRTLVFGLYDDVAIRVTGNETDARVDLRSASRFGSNDFGQNAERLRLIMKEIVARLEETVPTADGERPERVKRKIKSAKEADPKKPGQRRTKPPAQ